MKQKNSKICNFWTSWHVKFCEFGKNAKFAKLNRTRNFLDLQQYVSYFQPEAIIEKLRISATSRFTLLTCLAPLIGIIQCPLVVFPQFSTPANQNFSNQNACLSFNHTWINPLSIYFTRGRGDFQQNRCTLRRYTKAWLIQDYRKDPFSEVM